MAISAARGAALEILARVEATHSYASELLHSGKFANLSSADHGLLTELVMGVLRWRGALDQEISQHVRQPLPKLDIEVLSALRLGAYQLLFLTRIPAHAAINESVELVKRARKTSAAGMVNAVLRKVSSHPVAKNPTRVGQPRDCVSSSHPRWLIDRWENNYGIQAAQQICEYDQAAPPQSVRLVNPVVSEITPEKALDISGIGMSPGRLLARAATVMAGDVTSTPQFREGQLVIQDEASQLIALLVAGELMGGAKKILDCCAAPGGKTRILAQENPGSTIVALELHPRRAALLKRLVPEPNVRVIAADARHMPFRTAFDRILLDAPCSGTGTLARNPEIKWRLKPEDLLRLQTYQIEILQSALRQTAPGGRLVYSTCSLEPEENEQVIEKALSGSSEYCVLEIRERLEELRRSGELSWKDIDSLITGPYLRTVPGVHSCDGFFAAIIARQS